MKWIKSRCGKYHIVGDNGCELNEPNSIGKRKRKVLNNPVHKNKCRKCLLKIKEI